MTHTAFLAVLEHFQVQKCNFFGAIRHSSLNDCRILQFSPTAARACRHHAVSPHILPVPPVVPPQGEDKISKVPPPPVAETLLRTLGTFTTRKNLYIWADATALKLAYFLFQFSH